MKIICAQCGKEGSAAPNKIRKGYGIFCSRKCASSWRSAHNTEEKICLICGKSYRVIKQRATEGQGKYCSYVCRGIGTQGKGHTNWRGGRRVHNGYVLIYHPDHPRANKGYIPEHILIAEKSLGHCLPRGAVVHHSNQIKSDNRPSNLVICQDNAYHQTIHKRMRRRV